MPPPQPITIRPPRREDRGEYVRVSFPVGGIQPDTLWFDVSAEHEDLLDDGCDAGLMALLAVGMASRRPIRVEGAVSERLLWGLRHTVLPVTTRILPFLRAVDLEVEELRRDDPPADGAVLTGLSCGVDSLALIHDHMVREDRFPGFEPTHFLYAHIGHHGYGPDRHELAEARWETVRSAARELERPVVRVSSNTPDFYPNRYDDRLNWAAALTLRMASVPLLLQGGVRRFLFGSSHDFSETRLDPSPLITVADPVIVPMLGTERIELHPVGADLTRTAKTERIADWDLAQRYLDVCIMEGSNCSRCSKCLRTLLTIEVLGRLEDFSDVFDLATYHDHRIAYIAETLAEPKEHFRLEVRRLIEAREFQPPGAARRRAGALRLWRTIPHGVRRRLRGLPTRNGRA